MVYLPPQPRTAPPVLALALRLLPRFDGVTQRVITAVLLDGNGPEEAARLLGLSRVEVEEGLTRFLVRAGESLVHNGA